MRAIKGFTLVELVMVILLLGVMATFTSQFIGIGTQIYGDASRREQLMSDARFALERLNRELRDAVPGSVRIEDAAGNPLDQGACLRFWPIATASRYLGSAASGGLTIVAFIISLNLRAGCPPGSVCWGGSVRRCFCSARWRASRTPMTGSATFSASGQSERRWRHWNFS